jgi:hypothetical protein
MERKIALAIFAGFVMLAALYRVLAPPKAETIRHDAPAAQAGP